MGFIRKYLSGDGLHKVVRHCFYREKFCEYSRSNISWQDCIMSGLAVFGLKFPSLLKFEQSQNEPFIKRNLKKLYHVCNVPSDSCMRERLDVLLPQQFRMPFRKIFSYLQRGKVLERFKYFDEYYLMSIDGTGQY